MAKKEEQKNLHDTLKALEDKYGKGVILQQEDEPQGVKSIPTGCYAIDNLLGCGGLPISRIIEIYGAESSGKSTTCLFFAAQVQKQGGKVVYLDVEQAYDQKYAEMIGVNTKELIVAQPSTLEETLDITRAFCASNEIDLIVIDSVAAMVPKQDLEEGGLEKESMAVKARLMSKYLAAMTGEIAKSKTIVVFINQTRDNVGVFYGEKTTTPGGKALKFYSSVRLCVSKADKIKKGELQIGQTLKIVAKKNKVGFPYKEGTFDLYFGSGIDLYADTFDMGLQLDIINKNGNTYEFNGKKLGVGRDQAKAALAESPDNYNKIRESIDAVLSGKTNNETRKTRKKGTE